MRQVARSEASEGKAGGQIDVESYRKRFIEAMDDDFGTAQALATLFDLVRDVNRVSEEGYSVIQGKQLLSELAGLLGLTLKVPEEEPFEASPFIDLLISTRDQLREAKQWQLADRIRTKLDEADITLEDTPKGTVWKRKR